MGTPSAMDCRVLITVLAVGVVAALSACGSDKDTPAPAATNPATSASPSPTSVAPTSEDPTEDLKRALLTAADIGPGFVEGVWQPPDPNEPSPCGKPSASAQFPNAIRIGAEFAKGQDLRLTQGINVFADTATAKAAYAAGVDGLSCAQATVGGQPVTIGAPTDVTAGVGGETATGWTIKAAGLDGVLIAVQAEQAVLTFTFLALGGADTSTVTDPVTLARTGVGKAMAA